MVASEFINCAKLGLRLPEFPCYTVQTYTQAGLWRSLRAWNLLPKQCLSHHKSTGGTKGHVYSVVHLPARLDASTQPLVLLTLSLWGSQVLCISG